MSKISVVVPVYKCALYLENLYSELKNIFDNYLMINYEVIFINDASQDNSYQIMKMLSMEDKKVKSINLSRNFGQHAAILAGLEVADGEYVIIMDCDMQDHPKDIIKLYNAIDNTEYDVVLGVRKQRHTSKLKKIASKAFNNIIDYFSDDQNSDYPIVNFGIFKQQVIKEYVSLKEHGRALSIFIRWLGFSVHQIEVDFYDRECDVSSYSFFKMVNLAINTITSYSQKPLMIFMKLGFLISLTSFLYGLYIVINKIMDPSSVIGWTSIVVLISFFGGLILVNLALIGLYLGKVLQEAKNRPIYIIKEKINL